MKRLTDPLRLIPAALLMFTAATPIVEAAQFRSAAPNNTQAKAQPSQQTILELYEQVQTLQEEIRQLRNKVEIQDNETKRLKSRLRSISQDLDKRVQGLERSGGSVRRSGSTSSNKKPSRAVTSSNGGDQKAYDVAFRLMRQGDYSRASNSFRKFLKTYPGSSLSGNAQYWIAEANYLVRNYKLALEEFQKVVRNHPNSRKVPDAMLKIGYSHYELRAYKKAKQTLAEITFRYPNTLVSRSAKSRLALMKKEGR